MTHKAMRALLHPVPAPNKPMIACECPCGCSWPAVRSVVRYYAVGLTQKGGRMPLKVCWRCTFENDHDRVEL